MKIEDISNREDVSDYKTRGFYTSAKKVDCGGGYIIFISGIEPYKQEDSNRVLSDDIEKQTHEVFEQIGQILKKAGCTFENVVKAVIYITDMNNFSKISPIRAHYFEKSAPASTMIEVSRLKRDGAQIEIEVTAFLEK